ncbi:hypothetical protein [Actinokineospora diospyrosa]|uniref:hypothetical protein n=1 Tax=Actinokineospora diospyrosa TaxID=103728 RepID=UPI0020A34934|nr:hypothetical protein [Actinokineospora diospyrosa]
MTNVMVSVDMGDSRVVELFNEWCRADLPKRNDPGRRGTGSLRLITGEGTQWGGPRYPECVVWAGTLNHADLGAVVDWFRGAPWRYPNQFQLFLLDQEQAFFRVWMIREGEIRQYAPTVPHEDDDDFDPPDDIFPG